MTTIIDAEAIGRELARRRRLGETTVIALASIESDDDAENIQRAALEAFSSDLKGYSIQPRSGWMKRLIGVEAPIWCPLTREDFISAEQPFRLPYGVLGAGAGFAFVFGRAFPALHDENRPTLEDAVVSCVPILQILGRRLSGSTPVDRLAATADFGLNVAIVEGVPLANWRSIDLTNIAPDIFINDQRQLLAQERESREHPLHPILRLSLELRRRDSEIEAGEIVAAGVRTGLAQIAPGQTIRADFGGLADITLRLA